MEDTEACNTVLFQEVKYYMLSLNPIYFWENFFSFFFFFLLLVIILSAFWSPLGHLSDITYSGW